MPGSRICANVPRPFTTSRRRSGRLSPAPRSLLRASPKPLLPPTRPRRRRSWRSGLCAKRNAKGNSRTLTCNVPASTRRRPRQAINRNKRASVLQNNPRGWEFEVSTSCVNFMASLSHPPEVSTASSSMGSDRCRRRCGRDACRDMRGTSAACSLQCPAAPA